MKVGIKSLSVRLISILLSLQLAGPAAFAEELPPDISSPLPSTEPAFVPDELLVRFKASVEEQRRNAMLTASGALVRRRYKHIAHTDRKGDLLHIRLPQGTDLNKAIKMYQADPNVAYVQPNYRLRVALDPNDPFYVNNQLWGLKKISMPQAWDITTGDLTVVVADIDTGVNYNHEDLKANMWKNPGEIPGNGKDDDRNGYIDDVYGIDSKNHDSDPMDDYGHGTHTAGTVGAVGNNGIGVVGVNWNVKVMALKFIGADGYGDDAGAVECFNYVLAMKNKGVNIRVTTNSWGGTQAPTDPYPQALKDAMDAVGDAGIVNVAAAGNDGQDVAIEQFYPACYATSCLGPTGKPSTSILAVAASDSADNRPSWSNFGATSVHLAAPGASIWSTYRNSYASSSGTSMATPHVAGAAALLAAKDPTLSVGQSKGILMSNVDVLPQWTGIVISNGRLNVYKALTAIKPPDQDVAVQSFTLSPTLVGLNKPVTATVVIKNLGTLDVGAFAVDFYKDLSSPPKVGQAGDYRWTVSSLAAGAQTTLSYTFTLPAYGAYHAYVLADTNGQLAETDEFNMAGPRLYWVSDPAPQPAPGGGSYYVKDPFTAPDGATLKEHRPDVAPVSVPAPGYTIQSGWESIQGNVLRGSICNYCSDAILFDSTVSDNITVQTDFIAGGTPRGGLLLRGTDSGHVFVLEYNSGNLTLTRNQPGNTKTIGSAPISGVNTGSVHKIKAALNGPNFQAYWDGSKKIDVNDGYNQSVTTHGLFMYLFPSGVQNAYDNFEVIQNETGGNNPPTVANPASANPNPVTGTTTNLSVLGADDGGEANLTYTWYATGPAAVTFSANGTNAAKNTTATFTTAGSYTFTATIKDAGGQSVTSSVNVAVNQTYTSVTVSPANGSVGVGQQQMFTASALDQFGNALATQPTFSWTVSVGGTINGSGVFTAGMTPGGPHTVTATATVASVTKSGTAQVTVTSAPYLTLSKTSDRTSAGPNDVITYTVSYQNTGDRDAASVAITDVVPAAVSFVLAGQGGTYDPNTNTITWTIGTVPAGTAAKNVGFQGRVK